MYVTTWPYLIIRCNQVSTDFFIYQFRGSMQLYLLNSLGVYDLMSSIGKDELWRDYHVVTHKKKNYQITLSMILLFTFYFQLWVSMDLTVRILIMWLCEVFLFNCHSIYLHYDSRENLFQHTLIHRHTLCASNLYTEQETYLRYAVNRHTCSDNPIFFNDLSI